MTMFGIYSNNLERFLIINNDLFLTIQTAKLLSSKFCLSVCKINNSICIDNSNCLTWSLTDPSMAAADRQIPRLTIIDNNLFDTKTYPAIPKELLFEYHEFCKLVYNIVKASRITDALLNSNDQSYFLRLLDIQDPTIVSLSDESGLEIPFLLQIDKVLYMSTSIKEINENIEEIFFQYTTLPSNVALYKKTFYHYLDNHETIL